MANMFKGLEKKRIPKTIKECIEPEEMVNHLYRWAKNMETIGKWFFG